MRKVLFLSLLLYVALFEVVAQALDRNKNDGPLPPMPIYSDTTQWYITNRNSDIDIFYIISTETGDYQQEGATCHFADTYTTSTRLPLLSEMQGVDNLLSGKLNFYSPYYRQCSMQTFASDSLLNCRLPVAMSDVRRAFDYYLHHLNGGRPFILAGYSQGGMIAIQLLKEMDQTTLDHLVACYIIGATISSQDLKECPAIKPAQNATDTGVTICYNSVRDASCALDLYHSSKVAINPVNWRTDSTVATLITEPSPIKPGIKQEKDTLSVHLDTASGLIFVDGFTATDYVLPIIGKQGCYHSREIWLYRNCLRSNMQARASAFRSKQ